MKKLAFPLVALLFGVGGCALTSKADALDIRYFTPEHVKQRLSSADSGGGVAGKGSPSLEIGRVSSDRHLREKMVHRDSAYEVGFYDDRRWTEWPEVYVKRALARTLFEERGLHRAVTGNTPILDVEVIAFEEVREAQNHAARIELRIILRGAADELLEETLTIDRPIGTTPGQDPVVGAMAEALDAAADEVATKILAAMPAADATAARDAKATPVTPALTVVPLVKPAK